MNITRFLSFIILISLLSCSNNKSGYNQKWEVNSDTLPIKGRCAIFYSPSQPEYDLFAQEDSTGEIDAVIDDFDYYISIAKDSVERYDKSIKMLHTASRYIAFSNNEGKVYVVDKYSDCDHIVGYIYFDGISKPTITCGVGTEDDIMMEIRQYLPKN